MARARAALLALFAAAMVVACANPYSMHYRGRPDARAVPGYTHQAQGPAIYRTSDPIRDGRELYRRGYVLVGTSFFQAGANFVSPEQVLEQARKLGAHVVLTAEKYSHSSTMALPMSTPSRSTSFSTGSATAFGPAGTVTATGSAVTNTYSTSTTFVPFTVNLSNFGAGFFAKVKPRFGLSLLPLDDAARQRIQSNSGALVDFVIDDSPAFHADILPGDIVLSIDGKAPRDNQTMFPILDAAAGKDAVVVLRRGDARIEKSVPVLPIAR